MDGLKRVDISRMGGVHFVDGGWNNATGSVERYRARQRGSSGPSAGDGRGHPTILIAMV